MDCPDPECRLDLIERINGKVSKMVLISVMSAVLAFGGGFILYAMAANKSQTNSVVENKRDITIIQTDLKHITKAQNEIKATVKRIEENQVTKEMMHDIIQGMREGSQHGN